MELQSIAEVVCFVRNESLHMMNWDGWGKQSQHTVIQLWITYTHW